MTLRGIFLTVHRYLGLVAALPLVLAGVTGAILVFEGEIDRAINHSYWAVQPQGQPLPWRDIIAAAGEKWPKDSVGSVRFPSAPDVAAELAFRSGMLASVDPYTGRILGTRRQKQIVTASIHQFHTHLLAGEVGGWIMGTSAALLLLLSVTGLVLWWRRKGFGVNWSAPWRRVNYDAHHALGIYVLLPWFILGLSGAAITFDKWAQPALYWITRSSPAKAPPQLISTPTAGATPISIDDALTAARETLPGAEPIVITTPAPYQPAKMVASTKSKMSSPAGSKRPGVFMVFMKFPEDHTPSGRSRVAIDQFSGSPVWIVNSRTVPAGTHAWNLVRPIHTGDIFGWPTRIFACVASALLAWQAISGIWLWWPRKMRSQGDLVSTIS